MSMVTPFSVIARDGLTIRGDVTIPDGTPRGLAFVQHGIGTSRQGPHIQAICEIALRHHLIVVSFDNTHSFGASDGDLSSLTATTCIHNLEDVIAWASVQDFYREPFTVLAHSMGALSALHYAAQHPDRIQALAALSAVSDGTAFANDWRDEKPQRFIEWEQTGRSFKDNPFKPGEGAYYDWAIVTDVRTYNVLPSLSALHCPVLLAVGEQDNLTPVSRQETLRDHLKDPVELHVIPNGSHSFRSEPERQNLSQVLDHWLSRIL